LVDGECVAGVYTIDVYSGEPVDRVFSVVYVDGDVTFWLTNHDKPGAVKQLTALFTTAPASAKDSTLEVAPESPIEVGESYTATVTVKDAFGNPVDGQEVEFGLDGWESCRATIDGDPKVTSSDKGRAKVTITAERGGECELWAALDGDSLDGYPELVWQWPEGPPADPTKTTVVITPSVPPASPVGLPSPIALDAAYEVVVTAYADDGQTPVPGAAVTLSNHTADARWLCMVEVTEVGGDDDAPSLDLTTETDANGQVHALVRYGGPIPGPGTLCELKTSVDGTRFDRLGEHEEGYPIPSYLSWRSALDLTADWTFYEVSDEWVEADGDDSGTVEVRLWSATGLGLVDLSKLKVSVPSESDLTVGEFVETAFNELGAPSGVYSASFTGTVAGQWPIEVLYDGEPVNLKEGGNGLARLKLAEPPRPVGSELRSRASITDLLGQAGVYGAAGATSDDYGKQTITATVLDADGKPVVDAADKLAVRPGPGDLAENLPDSGLGFSDGGFQCAEPLVDGACQAGEYTIDVYSAHPETRYLNVAYVDGEVSFVLTTADPPGAPVKQLVALFTTAPASAEHSSFALDPQEGPIEPGLSYMATVTVSDKFGNLVSGELVEFSLSSPWDCPVSFDDPATEDDLETSVEVLTSDQGEAVLSLAGQSAGTCGLEAYIGSEGDWLGELFLVWAWDGPAADPAKSTVVITPSDPAEDPAGDPLAILSSDAYEVVVTTYAEDGVTPAPGAPVELTFTSWTYMSCYPAPVVSSDGPGWFERYQRGRTGADGTLRLSIALSGLPYAGLRSCVLQARVEGEEVPRIDADGVDHSPAQLIWLERPDPSGDYSYYAVSEDGVEANGKDHGTVEVELRSTDGYLAMIDLSKLEISAPPESRLVFGEWVNQSDFGWPAGPYEVAFAGTAPGDWPVSVSYNGQPLSLEYEDSNGQAHMFGEGVPPTGAAAEKSSAAVSVTAGQPANHDAPSASPSSWGRQTLTVTLVDDADQPVVDAAAVLRAQAAAGDPVDGIGLYFANDGAFACAETPIDGECASGLYVLDVYASKAGPRQLEVVYATGTADQFTVAAAAGGTVLTTEFTVPPLDRLASTVVISPSTPGDDPDDPSDEPDSAPDRLDWGEVYTVVVTAWDEGRNNRVPNARVRARLTDQNAPARYCAGGQLWRGDSSGSALTLEASELGRVEFTVVSSEPGSKCKLEVWPVDWPEPGQFNQFSGSGRDLNWNDPEPDPELSYYLVDEQPVVANGYDFGTIRVNLSALVDGEQLEVGGDPALLTASAEDGASGIAVGPFAAVDNPAVGWYEAYFTGTAPGNWTINVAWNGIRLSAPEDLDVAHLVEASPLAPDPARSSVRLAANGLNPRATYADALADDAASGGDYFHVLDIRLADAQGNPVEDAAAALSVGLASSDPYGPGSFFAGSSDRVSQPGRVKDRGLGVYEVEVASFKPGLRQFKVTFSAGDLTFDLANAAAPASAAVPAAYLGRPASPEHSKLVVNPSTPTDLVTDLADPADGVPDVLAPGQNYEILVNLRDREGLPASDDQGLGDVVDVHVVSAANECGAVTFSDESGETSGVSQWVAFNVDPDTGLGKVFASSEVAATCQLLVRTESYTQTGNSNLLGSPKTLRWTAPSDPGQAQTWFDVSQAAVPADGSSTGQVTVSLRDSDGQPVTTAAASISAAGQVGAGLSFGAFSPLGGGLYQTWFTGTRAGDHPVTVSVGGANINVRTGGNDTAHLTDASPRAASGSASWVTITDKAEQWGVYGFPGAAPEQWGYQTIEVWVFDDNDQPITTAADKLSVYPSAFDDGGVLAYSDDGAFRCADEPVGGECLEGAYQIDVYSGKPVTRYLNVFYQDDYVEFAFRVLGSHGSTLLAAEFTTAPASAKDSTLAVEPEPPVLVGEGLEVTLTVRDQFGNLVSGQMVAFKLERDWDCPVTFDDPYTPEEVETVYGPVPTFYDGTAVVELEAEQAGVCPMDAYLAWEDDPDTWEHIGQAELSWQWPDGPPAVADGSTVVVTPSEPAGDPMGEPLPIMVGESYDVLVTALDEAGDPVPGAEVDFLLMSLTDMSCISPLVTSDAPGWGQERGRTGADGTLRVGITLGDPDVRIFGMCLLMVTVDDEPVPAGGSEDLPDTRLLVWLPAPDLESSATYYWVSEDPVVAGGEETGFVEARFFSDYSPALVDLSELRIDAPDDSGLVFGPWEDTTEPGALLPSGVYRATFSGTKPGAYPLEVYYYDDPVALGDDMNGTASLVDGGAPPSGGASAEWSWASVTRVAGQLANRDAPGLAESGWGRQTV
ncbi:MAG: Ig-like domain-containing protein, partial [Bifidobacteriaceae bacterium]|nr:Ig-like domain-containing protein [Bifidobacteriaceae bacterium]